MKTTKVDGSLVETMKRFHGLIDEEVLEELKSLSESDNIEIVNNIKGYLVFYCESINDEKASKLKSRIIPEQLKELFISKLGSDPLKISNDQIDEFLKQNK